MTSPDLFWAVFAAVLGANILAGAFFWGLVSYTRLEREDRQRSDAAHAPLVAMIMPVAFLMLTAFTILY